MKMSICLHKVNNKLLRVEFVTRNLRQMVKFYGVEVSKNFQRRKKRSVVRGIITGTLSNVKHLN